MKNKYYERKVNNNAWELCQNRFKNNPNHPHNVCAVAPTHEGLIQMYSEYLSGGVDWLDGQRFTIYQISKIHGKYWWTGTLEILKNELNKYMNDDKYLWVKTETHAKRISGTKIK